MTEETEAKREPVTLMTIRVSRDSGKTWEPEKAYRSSDDLPALMTSAWPPCECWRHRAQREREEEQTQQLLADVKARNRWSRNRPA
ncbi:hypothetical protein AB0420_11425 [Streptomyces caelestis]|uniref:Uncharacterized protein n=1 Tax=Streptomyces heliomycini TaxID=284032 RepID=A0ABV5L9P8_9ACTN